MTKKDKHYVKSGSALNRFAGCTSFSLQSCGLSLRFAAWQREADLRLGKPASGRVSASVSVCACVCVCCTQSGAQSCLYIRVSGSISVCVNMNVYVCYISVHAHRLCVIVCLGACMGAHTSVFTQQHRQHRNTSPEGFYVQPENLVQSRTTVSGCAKAEVCLRDFR